MWPIGNHTTPTSTAVEWSSPPPSHPPAQPWSSPPSLSPTSTAVELPPLPLTHPGPPAAQLWSSAGAQPCLKPLISSSPHPLIPSAPHLLISSSPLFRISSFPYLPISFSPHLLIFLSPHLLIYPSPHLLISPSPHLPISPSSPLLISLSPHLLISSSPHLLLSCSPHPSSPHLLSGKLLGITKHSMNALKAYKADHTTAGNRAVEVGSSTVAMAVRALVLACVLLLVSTSALAQRGPPGGGPPGGQRGGPGAGSGGPGGPGGPGGRGGRDGPGGPGGPRGPPLNLTAVGNLTADVGAQLANCTVDQKTLNGSFHLAVFKNSTGNYNLFVEAMLVDAAGGPPDSVAIVKGAVCDAAATDVLALPLAAADWKQRAGWWLLHAEARLDAFLENADAATLDALLAVLPTASPPPTSGGGGSTGGARKGQGGEAHGAGAADGGIRPRGQAGGTEAGGT
ncbi:unnamed protein product [Closterium sp. NIES-64]|nr:unnamed protein product [Closterium sp. NIES-64]